MASVQEAPTKPSELTPEVSVAICGEHHILTKQVVKALAETEWSLEEALDEAEVLIGTYEQAGSAACAEVRELTKRYSESVVILVVSQIGAADVRRALQAGAHAVVDEAAIESALIPSIGAALAGQVVLPARTRQAGQRRVLTTREKQILGLVVMGMTNAEIATKLYLAESTVKSHLSSSFAKLGVSSRSEAAALILDPQSGAGLGILTIPSS